MNSEAEEKYKKLAQILGEMESALIAFSGGVDSSFLLKAASQALPGRIRAATARSVLNPPGEVEAAEALAADLGVPHEVIDFRPLELDAVKNNARDRCYHCKKTLAGLLKKRAADLGLAEVLEGSQADDEGVYRPGARALAESGLRSPLKEAGLGKNDIRVLSREMGLESWDRPAGGCLATRFPYEAALTEADLARAGAAERVLIKAGFREVRARTHGDLLRLEGPSDLWAALADDGFRAGLEAELRALGYRFVTIDAAGYRSGVYDRPEDQKSEV